MSHGVGHRRGLDPTLLWLWRRLAATAPIRPLAWEPPYAVGAALEKAKKDKQDKTTFRLLQRHMLPTAHLGTDAVPFANAPGKELLLGTKLGLNSPPHSNLHISSTVDFLRFPFLKEVHPRRKEAPFPTSHQER